MIFIIFEKCLRLSYDPVLVERNDQYHLPSENILKMIIINVENYSFDYIGQDISILKVCLDLEHSSRRGRGCEALSSRSYI